MKLGVFGSRTICDSRAAMIIAETVQKLSNVTTIVTTQEPRGVCEVAQRFAKEQHLILELHFLNVGKYAQGAFEHRSDEVIKAADYIVLIHDGVSHGTANELERTKKFCKPYRYEIIEPTGQFDRDIGFNVKNEWDSAKHKMNVADNTDNFNINDFI